MSPRAELLNLERRKLVLLRNKVAEQEQRVKMLEALEDDPLDAFLERELAEEEPVQATAHIDAPSEGVPYYVQPATPMSTVLTWRSSPRTPRRVPDLWVRLLSYLGSDGKTYEEVKAYIYDNKLPITEGAARTQLMTYRKEFGFVENPRKGFYRATDRALEFIKAQEGGVPAVAGGEPMSQPESLTGAAA